MKKNIVLSILAVAIIAAIGLFAVKNKGSIFSVKSQKAASTTSSAVVSLKDVSLLPEEIDVCMVFGDLGSVSSKIKNSAFGKEFASLPVWNFLDLEKNLKELTGALGDAFGGEINKEQLLSLFSKKITVGIDIKGGAPVITMLAQSDSNTIAEIKKIIASSPNKSNISVEKYQDTEINFLTPPTPDQPAVSYIIFDDSLICIILGGSIDNAKAMVERKSGLKKSLVANKIVQDVLNKDFSDQGFFFLNLANMAITDAAENTLPLSAVSGDMLKYIVGGLSFTDGANIEFKIYPNKDKMTQALLDMWFIEPKKLSVLKYAPAGSLFFTGSTQMKFEQLYTDWKNNLAGQNTEITKNFLANIENLKEKYNVDIDAEIIPNIGNEMAVICSAIEAKGLMPLIEINLALEVLNKNIINKNIEAVIKSLQDAFAKRAQEAGAETTASFTIEATEYNDIEIKQIKLPFMIGQALSPCYAFVDKYLVISSSITGMQKIIDVRGGKINSLVGSDSFGKVKDMLPETTNQMGFVDISKVLDSAISLSEWIVSFQRLSIPQGDTPEAIAQRQEAQQTEQLIRDNLVPLLKSLKVVKCLGVNTINKGNGKYVDQSFKLVIEDKIQAA